MNDQGRQIFYQLIGEHCGSPESVAEIGVLHPTHSYVEQFADAGCQTLLVDPQPFTIEACRERWGDSPNVTIAPVAIVDTPGEHVLLSPVGAPIDHLGGSYIEGVRGPQVARVEGDGGKPWCEPAQRITVEGVRFSSLDPSNLDAISIDVEGSEWFAFKHMISRPRVICFERDHWKSSKYVTPHVAEIEAWLLGAQYRFADRFGFDVFYVRSIDERD